MAKKEKKAPTFHEEMEGLLKERQFVFHGIKITSTTEYFNRVNNMVLDVLNQIADAQKDDTDKQMFKDMFQEHFQEIKYLRQLYDNLKK